MVPEGCRQCVFIECRKKQPGELEELSVKGSPAAEVPVEFRDAGGEVHFPHIVIGPQGSLNAVVHNYWQNGKRGAESKKGYYSLLVHALVLQINNNLEALHDLLAYTKGAYRLGEHWQWQELKKDMEIFVTRTDESVPLIGQLREYFTRVIVFSGMDVENTVDVDCYYHVFVNCREARPWSLMIDARFSTPEQLLQFNHASGEVHIPNIIIGPRGDLGAIIHNRWWNRKDGIEQRYGYYSMLPHAETLEIRDNTKALRDLADYAEGRYWPGRCWEILELSRDLRLRISGAHDAFLLIVRLSAYFRNIVVDGAPVAEYLAACEGALRARTGLRVGPLGRPAMAAWEVVLGGDESVYHIIGCDREIKRFVVKQQLEADQVVIFHGPGPVAVKEVCIKATGNLRSALQGYWLNGENGGCFLLLACAERLVVRSNPQALRDLLAYAEGAYPLDSRWKRQILKNLLVEVDCSAEDIPAVKQLRRCFKIVAVRVFSASLQENSTVTVECAHVVFINCRGVIPQTLTVGVRINAVWESNGLEFRDADSEVHFPYIIIRNRGDLRTVLQNRWENGRGDSGYYGLLHHVQMLHIKNNPGALQSLLAYVKGTYQLGGHWRPQELNRDMQIVIEHNNEDVPLIGELRGYFSRVAVASNLGVESVVDVDCHYHIFTNYEKIRPLSLIINASSTGSDVQLQFIQEDGEVHIPDIAIGPRGAFAAIVHNNWWNGKGGAGCRGGDYSLLHYAQKLEIQNNPQAVRDLVAYIQGNYQLGVHWWWQKLSGNMEIRIRQTNIEQQFVQALTAHFAVVILHDLHARDTAWTSMRESDNSVWGGRQHVFTKCRSVLPEKLGMLHVEGSPDAEVPVAFHDAGAEVRFPRIYVGEGGCLRAVLHNRWEDGKGGGGYYSLLPHARRLEIENNPQAVRDLLAYVDGTYPLGEHWQRQELPRGMEVTIKETDAEPRLVRALVVHFARVVLRNAQAGNTAWTSLAERDGAVEGSRQHVFTGCRGVPPEKLRTLCVRSSPVAEVPVEFWDAGGEVCFPYIHVESNGSLRAVLQNRWEGPARGFSRLFRDRRSGYYSLLHHAQILEIRGNPQAVRDLAAYVAGRYGTNDPRWPVRPLDRGLRLTIEGVDGCGAEIGALAEHLGAVRVDGGEVLSRERRQQLLADRNECEMALWLLRGVAADRGRVLGEAEGLLVGKLRDVRLARLRLQELRKRLDALAWMAQ